MAKNAAEVLAELEVLKEHVTRLEGVIHVMLEELENGTIWQSARDIRESLQLDAT